MTAPRAVLAAALAGALLLAACSPSPPPPRAAKKKPPDAHARLQEEMDRSVMASPQVVIVRLQSEGKRVEVTSLLPAEIAEARVRGELAKTIFRVNDAGDGLILFSRDVAKGSSYRTELKFAELERSKGFVFPVLQPDGSLKDRSFRLEQVAIPR